MALHREITNDCVALALYGVTTDADSVKFFYNDLIEWFNAVGCSPDKLSVHGPGFGGKPVSFDKADSRLRKQRFSEIRGITVFALLPDAQIPTVDWWATAYLDLSYKPCFVLESRISVTTLEDDRFEHLVRSCLSYLKPVYGIGYHRNHDKGPGFYAIGLNFAPTVELAVRPQESEEIGLAISRWGDLAMVKEVYKEGILRDVYPYNYVSEPQLSKRVGNRTLQDWISSDSSHGTLIKLDDRMMLWKVAVPQINSIREELWSSGIIFDWKSWLAVEQQ